MTLYVSGKLYALVLCQCCRKGNLNMDDIRNVEMDGKYVPVSLRVKVQFHLPCKSSSRDHHDNDHSEAIVHNMNVSPLANGRRVHISLNSLNNHASDCVVTTTRAVDDAL